MLTNEAHPSKPLQIDGRDVMAQGYRCVWFLFQGESWDIARFYSPDGDFTGYYADVLEPVRWQVEGTLYIEPVVDLFLDVWITPARAPHVLDEDEFIDAVERKILTTDQATGARSVLHHLLQKIDAGTFPPSVVRAYDRQT